MGKELERSEVLLQEMRCGLKKGDEILAFVNHHVEAQPNSQREEIAKQDNQA